MGPLNPRTGAELLGDDAVLTEIAAGVHEAGNPYFDHVLGGPEAARRILDAWVRRPSSEVFAGRARLLFEGETLVGGFVAMTGGECKRCRMADTAALLAAHRGDERTALLARLAGVKGIFAPLEDGDWYVSKVWVSPRLRGKGYGGLVSREAFFPEPRPPGRILADVAESNAAALATYRRLGLEIVPGAGSPSALRYAVVRRSSP